MVTENLALKIIEEGVEVEGNNQALSCCFIMLAFFGYY